MEEIEKQPCKDEQKINRYFHIKQKNTSVSKKELFQLEIILKNFSIQLTHFYFQRQSLVRKIDLLKHGGLINFRGSIMIPGMAKFQAMLQRKQPTEGVLKKAVLRNFYQLEKLTYSKREKSWSAERKSLLASQEKVS